MIPIEYVALLLVLVFGLVGLARRFPLEFGATIGFVAMLLMFDLADRFLSGAISRGMAGVGIADDPSLSLWAIYSAGIAMWVAFMYIGQTLRFPGSWPPGKLIGAGMDLSVGLLNGWLVIGTWWYYTDKLGYPIQRLGLYVPPLTPTAQSMIAFTPQALIPDAYSLFVVGGLLVALIGLRVIR
jgi:hypothetical protein